ncbi:MAG: hypothetical protein AB7V39_23635, partial [Nitrospiraceae bacterium]
PGRPWERAEPEEAAHVFPLFVFQEPLSSLTFDCYGHTHQPAGSEIICGVTTLLGHEWRGT